MLCSFKTLRSKVAFFICLAIAIFQPQVQAIGYDQGLYSIHAFESTIHAFEEENLAKLSGEETAELYYAVTQLLFDVQSKIIQCKVLSKASGYPLYMRDWKRYKDVRLRVERLVSSLCRQHKALDPIGDMQELENAFFKKVVGIPLKIVWKPFLKVLGKGCTIPPAIL